VSLLVVALSITRKPFRRLTSRILPIKISIVGLPLMGSNMDYEGQNPVNDYSCNPRMKSLICGSSG